MKTIKELEAIRNEATEISVKTFEYGKIEALKDVLKLIDEIENVSGGNISGMISAEELKQKINGE